MEFCEDREPVIMTRTKAEGFVSRILTESLHAALPGGDLKEALASQERSPYRILHSDRGVQDACGGFEPGGVALTEKR